MNTEPKLIGYRQGIRQMWPIYDRPIYYPPTVIGGQCPPYAPITPYGGGYTCVEKLNAFGEDTPPVSSSSYRTDDTLFLGVPNFIIYCGGIGAVIGIAMSPKDKKGTWAAMGFGVGAVGSTIATLAYISYMLPTLMDAVYESDDTYEPHEH